jgi:hypothetical protein
MVSHASRHREKFEGWERITCPSQTLVDPIALNRVGYEYISESDKARRLMSIRLHEDLKRLDGVRSKTKANALKVEILPHYQDYCAALVGQVLKSTNPILSWCSIWCFDVGDYRQGLLLAETVLSFFLIKPCGLKHTLAPPEFRRNMAELLSELLSNVVIKSPEPMQYVGYLESLMILTQGHDVHDLITAKLYRAYAMSLETSDPETSLHYYQVANKLKPMTTINKKIKYLTDTLKGKAL